MASLAFDDQLLASGVQRNPNLGGKQLSMLAGVEDFTVLKPQGWLRNLVHNSVRDPQLNDRLCGPREPAWWYTGEEPTTLLGENTELVPRAHPDLSSVTREQTLDYFKYSWLLTDELFSSLQGLEAFYRPPYHNQRHPMIFYYVHPAVLYINKLRVAGLLSGPIDPEIESLFESGVDSMSWDDLSKNENLWPSFDRCIEYRRSVYKRLIELISQHPAWGANDQAIKIDPDSQLWAIYLGIAHEAIHFETSSVLMREMPLSLLQKPIYWPQYHHSYVVQTDPENMPPSTSLAPVKGTDFPSNEFLAIAEAELNLGRGDSTVRVFGWDNEFGAATVTVPTFNAATYPVTNGEFYEFVSSGAYLDDVHWTVDGKAWRNFRNAKWPTFWVPRGPQGLHDYALRVIFEVVDMPWGSPVVTNFHEATAFANWKRSQLGLPVRIATEAEVRVLRNASLAVVDSQHDPVLSTTQHPPRHNFNLAFGAETPVDAFAPTSQGVYDVAGNVWHWCFDWFMPLPGFKTHAYYIDFSTPCFDREHNSIHGGSFVSVGNLAGHYARYHFRPFFFQHAGFRLAFSNAVGASESPTACQPVPTIEHLLEEREKAVRRAAGEVGGARTYDYESSSDLAKYLALHFNDPNDSDRLVGLGVLGGSMAKGFSHRVAHAVADFLEQNHTPRGRLLDLGCAVGGTSFELARSFDSVVGIDLSSSFIHAAEQLKRGDSIKYQVVEEGLINRTCAVALEPSLLDVAVRCDFRVGDACELPANIGCFDAILMCNLLCRLPDPRQCLAQLLGANSIIKSGGLLFLFTPCSWSFAFTEAEKWLGGRIVDDKEIRTVDGIQSFLQSEFQLLHSGDMPLIIRFHSRKFELIISQFTVWKKL